MAAAMHRICIGVQRATITTAIILIICVSYIHTANPALDPNHALCLLDDKLVTCQVALFSQHTNFSIDGEVVILPHNLCSKSVSMPTTPTLSTHTSTTRKDTEFVGQDRVGVVQRGGCAFDEKAKNAVNMGLKALVLVNTEPTIFPMGSADALYRSSVPVVMVGSDMYAHLKGAEDVNVCTQPGDDDGDGDDAGGGACSRGGAGNRFMIEYGTVANSG
jgi:hypothetical protein